MSDHNDAVDDDVLAAFSDHLDSHDRQLAGNLMRLMETGRGIDPSVSTPSLEALLAGTEFVDNLRTER